MRKALLISVLALGLGTASPALADADAISISVTTADLDLSKPAHAKRLRIRLDRAATAACAAPGSQGVLAFQAFNVCKSAALDGVRSKADQAVAAASRSGDAKIKTARR